MIGMRENERSTYKHTENKSKVTGGEFHELGKRKEVKDTGTAGRRTRHTGLWVGYAVEGQNTRGEARAQGEPQRDSEPRNTKFIKEKVG